MTTSHDGADRVTIAGPATPSGSAGQEVPADDAWDHQGSSSSAFTPRWGRIALALLGLMALLAAFITLVLGAFRVVSLGVPVLCLVVGVASVVGLRLLVVRSRRARVDQAFAAAMAPTHAADPEPGTAAITAPVPAAASHHSTVLFDADDAARTGDSTGDAEPRPLTAMELRTAALAVAHGSSAVDVPANLRDGDDADPAAPVELIAAGRSGSAQPGSPAGATAWVPVEVPRPTYVDAARVDRSAPAPLELPDAPRPSSSTPIKTAEAAARRTAGSDAAGADSTLPPPAEKEPSGQESGGQKPHEDEAGESAASGSAEGSSAESPQGRGGAPGESTHSRIDLDDVLQRRRA